MSSEIRYRNTDLDLVSKADLARLVRTFQDRGVDPFSITRYEDLNYVTIEKLVGDGETPEGTIASLLAVIEAFDEQDRRVWSDCEKREFNIGYDSGTHPASFTQELSNDLLRRIAQAGATVAITLYPPDVFASYTFSGPDAQPQPKDVVDVDLADVTTPAGLHELLRTKLGLPNDAGPPWVAFFDALRDPSRSKLPAVLRISGWLGLRERLPADAVLMRACLEDLPADRLEATIEWVNPRSDDD